MLESSGENQFLPNSRATSLTLQSLPRCCMDLNNVRSEFVIDVVWTAISCDWRSELCSFDTITICRTRRPRNSLAFGVRHSGHVLRSEDSVLREVLVFIPDGGACGRGRPRRRYFDTIKSDMADRSINIASKEQHWFWEELATIAVDRQQWRSRVGKGGR